MGLLPFTGAIAREDGRDSGGDYRRGPREDRREPRTRAPEAQQQAKPEGQEQAKPEGQGS